MINKKSIAVLPFYSISSDAENRYFADGVSEEIINALSRIKGLKVTSRTSSFIYRNSTVDVRQIGEALGVSSVLEGSIRRQGERVRITAQLVSTDSGFQIWSDSFDRELSDIFLLQDEISQLIAERIRENFGHLEIESQLVATRTDSTAAYNSYLQGRYYQLQWNQEGLLQALQCYKQSITYDKDYPMAYLGLSQCFTYLSARNLTDRIKGFYMAHHFLSKLGTEHEYIPEYHFTKGLFQLFGKWEFDKANRFFGKALSINANYADALQAQATIYNAVGDFASAEKAIDKALDLNPNSPNHYYTKGRSNFLKGDFKQAIRFADKALSTEENWELAFNVKVLCLILLGEESSFQGSLNIAGVEEQNLYNQLWHVYHKTGQESSFNVQKDHKHSLLNLYILIYQGHAEEAMESLKEAVENRDSEFLNFQHDPFLAPLKKLQAFNDLCLSVFPGEGVSGQFTEVVHFASTKYEDDEFKEYVEALKKVMEEDKAYQNAELTLKSLAELIELHPNKLSWILNEQVGKNFNEYVNSYRLEEFKKIVMKPENNQFTLLGLAFECGFNSKSAFNDFFKKATGLTPRAWVKSQQLAQ